MPKRCKETALNAPPVAYLAYHDTIEPHPGLSCRSPTCGSNGRRASDATATRIPTTPRARPIRATWKPLKRYLELSDGRGHVFEYYADAILWGGLGFATPAIVARDLRAYRALGITSVSCLTFGAFSVLAYPVNLEAFVRARAIPASIPMLP